MKDELKDEMKSKQELLDELQKMRKRVSELEKAGVSREESLGKERRHTETPLGDPVERYRFLTEKMNDLIWTMDLNMRTTYVSPSVKKMLGFTPEERMNQKAKDQLTPASYKIARKALAEELARELSGRADPNRARVMELEYYHKDGSIRILENLICGVRDSKGKLTGLHGVSRDITERKQTEKALKKSLEEKEILLKEINHRVKNNLNMINSMISLQAGKIKTKKQAEEACKEIRNRIHSISLVHEKLYQSDVFTKIDMKDYVKKMTETLLGIYHDREEIDCDLRIDDIRVDINKAIYCGLILNELISNALKHAFSESEKKKLVISLKKTKHSLCEIMVKDNGIGLKGDLEELKEKSMGLQLVTILNEQLQGKLSMSAEDGTEFKIAFPIEEKNREKKGR